MPQQASWVTHWIFNARKTMEKVGTNYEKLTSMANFFIHDVNSRLRGLIQKVSQRRAICNKQGTPCGYSSSIVVLQGKIHTRDRLFSWGDD